LDVFQFSVEDCALDQPVETCEETCIESDCEVGQWCVITECVNSCSGASTCKKEFLTNNYDFKTKDCNADRSDDCVDQCEWTEECPNDEDVFDQCWMEECDNGCGKSNCTHWFQQNGEWAGHDCSSTNVRAQDVFNMAAETAATGAMAFDDTIMAAVQANCPGGLCAGVVDISPVLSGQMTVEELAMLYANSYAEGASQQLE
jgi:hypothetical protein